MFGIEDFCGKLNGNRTLQELLHPEHRGRLGPRLLSRSRLAGRQGPLQLLHLLPKHGLQGVHDLQLVLDLRHPAGDLGGWRRGLRRPGAERRSDRVLEEILQKAKLLQWLGELADGRCRLLPPLLVGRFAQPLLRRPLPSTRPGRRPGARLRRPPPRCAAGGSSLRRREGGRRGRALSPGPRRRGAGYRGLLGPGDGSRFRSRGGIRRRRFRTAALAARAAVCGFAGHLGSAPGVAGSENRARRMLYRGWRREHNKASQARHPRPFALQRSYGRRGHARRPGASIPSIPGRSAGQAEG